MTTHVPAAPVPPPLARRFPHRAAEHCASGAMRDLLEHHGLAWGPEPLSEAMVFGLSGALSFVYGEDVALPGVPGASVPLYVLGRGVELEPGLAATLGIALESHETDDATEAWDALRRRLDAGEPTLVWANASELSHLDVRLDNTRHAMVVVAYDEAEGLAWVADQECEGVVPCTLESLARARASRAFPGATRHRAFATRFPERLPDPRAAVAAGVRQAIDRLEGIHEHPQWRAREGLAALDELARAYPGWPARYGEGARTMRKLLHVYVARAGNGGALFRSLQAAFLAEAADLLGDAALRPAAAAYEHAASGWRELAAAVRRRDDETGAAQLLDELRASERAALAAMRGWLQQAQRGGDA
jgi:hypothetical protein